MGTPEISPPLFAAGEGDDPEEYGPWQWEAAFGRATGRFGADAFTRAGGWQTTLSSLGLACG